MSSKILITGANGYVGKHVVKALIDLGHKNILLTDIHEKSFFDGVRYIQWDAATKSEAIIRELKNCQYVFFFGGLTGTIKSIENYDSFIDVNEKGLLNLLTILKNTNPLCKVIFPSTRLVYKGKKSVPLKEDDEKEFKTIYAMNKFASENYLKIYYECYGIPFSIFRICVPFANTVDDKFSYGTISQFLNRARENRNILIFGDGSQRRTFTHITDLVNVLIQGAFSEQTSCGVFNVGGADNLSILEAAKKIADLYNVSIEFKEWSELDQKIESGDTVFDSTKLDAITSYTYRNSFDNWIRQSLSSPIQTIE